MFLTNWRTVFAAALLFGVLAASAHADVDCDIFGPFAIDNRAGIPTVSEWGLIGTGVLTVLVGGATFGRRHRAKA